MNILTHFDSVRSAPDRCAYITDALTARNRLHGKFMTDIDARPKRQCAPAHGKRVVPAASSLAATATLSPGASNRTRAS